MKSNEVVNKSHGVSYLIGLSIVGWLLFPGSQADAQPQDPDLTVSTSVAQVIVHPQFGGILLGYDIDRNGTEGILSEFVPETTDGKSLVATEIFDQKSGAILKVVAKEDFTLDDYVTEGINAADLGLVLFEHNGQDHLLTLNPLTGNKFTGMWTPPIKTNYGLAGISVSQGTPEVAAYQSSFVTGLTFVFKSNIAKNTFGPQISLKSIIDVNEFFMPQIALDPTTNEAVLADSQDCVAGPLCSTSIALVNLSTGAIRKFSKDLGTGRVNGLAVDPTTGIACTTTLIDQGVEFYNLARETGFRVQIPNAGNAIQAGLGVGFDNVHHLFLIPQYSSNGGADNPEPRVYVYDETGQVKETITGLLRMPISPSLVALNPSTRTGFIPVVVEPQNLVMELQSFTY